MIRPDLIAQLIKKGVEIPKPIREAYDAWALFVTASTQWTDAGVGVLPIKHSTLVGHFFDSLYDKGGTYKEVRWLIKHDVMELKHMPVWETHFQAGVERRYG
jgi:hypothetical protein